MENHVIPRQYIRSNCAEDAFQWLLTGDVKAESESVIIAAQDQALQSVVQQKDHNRPDCTTLYQHAHYWHNYST